MSLQLRSPRQGSTQDEPLAIQPLKEDPFALGALLRSTCERVVEKSLAFAEDHVRELDNRDIGAELTFHLFEGRSIRLGRY